MAETEAKQMTEEEREDFDNRARLPGVLADAHMHICSTPKLPEMVEFYIPRSSLVALSSREWGQHRGEVAKPIAGLEKQVEEFDAKLAKANTKAAEVAVQLKKAEANPTPENAGARSSLLAIGQQLHLDAHTLLQQKRAVLTQLQLIRAELEDDLLKWAKARTAYCDAALAKLSEAKAEADEILRWKADEEKGHVRKDAK